MVRIENEFIPCPVCGGTPIDHGPHDWRFDKWSLTEPVVWRCRVCNAAIQMCSRETFHTAIDKGFAGVGHNVMRNKLIPTGRVKVFPCDVCGGSGVVPVRDETEDNRVRALIARRAAKSWKGLMPRIGPLLKARDLAVVTICPRCGKNDRAVPIVQTIGTDEDLTRRWRYGEAIIDGCTGQNAHYCGRCDLQFGDAAEEFMAGLQW
jgi:hypothetical protein